MTDRDEWGASDFGLCLFYTILGGLILGCTIMAMIRDYPLSLWIHGWILGPILLLVGVGSLVRFIWSTGRTRPPDQPKR